MKNKRDLGHRKLRNKKFTNLFPVGLIFSDTTKDTLLTCIGFIPPKKALKFSIF